MPTAQEFREASGAFGEMRDAVQGGSSWLREDWSTAVAGGRLAHVVGEAISASDGMTKSIFAVFDDLVTECEYRASVCDEYQAKYDTYCTEYEEYVNGTRDTEPAFPPKPQPWIKVTW